MNMEQENISGEFNIIYKKLVKDETDIIGHIAYSIYKAKKVEFIENFKEERKRFPSKEEINIFHRTSLESMQFYNERATTILQSFSNAVLDEAFEEMEDEYIKDQNSEMKLCLAQVLDENIEIHKKLIKSAVGDLNKENRMKRFLTSSWSSALGSFFYTTLVIFIVLIIGLATGGLKEYILKSCFKDEIKEQTEDLRIEKEKKIESSKSIQFSEKEAKLK